MLDVAAPIRLCSDVTDSCTANASDHCLCREFHLNYDAQQYSQCSLLVASRFSGVFSTLPVVNLGEFCITFDATLPRDASQSRDLSPRECISGVKGHATDWRRAVAWRQK